MIGYGFTKCCRCFKSVADTISPNTKLRWNGYMVEMAEDKEDKCESIWNKMAIFLPARAENQIGVISVDKKFQIINLLEF